MKRTLLNIMMGLVGLAAAAQTPLDEVVASVLRNNRATQAEIAGEKASLAASKADNSLDGLAVGAERMWSADPAKKDKWAISVSQEFKYPGVYRAQSQANSFSEQAISYVEQGILSDKALSVKLLIIDIINAQARLAFYEELGRNLAQIDELTRRSFDLGNSTVLDFRKMQLAVMENNHQIADCRADLEALKSSLKGQGAEFADADELWRTYPLQVLNEPSTNCEDYYEYHVGNLRAQAAAASVRAVKRSALPSFGLGYRHAYEDGTHFNGLTFSIKLPSYSQKRRRQAATLEAESLTANYDGRLALAMAENLGYYNSAKALSTSLADYRGLSGDNSYLDLLKKAYDGGELTIIDYLHEVNLFATARLNFLDLEYRYNLTLAKLNRYRALEFN